MLTAKCTVSFFFIEYYTNIHMAITGNYEKKTPIEIWTRIVIWLYNEPETYGFGAVFDPLTRYL